MSISSPDHFDTTQSSPISQMLRKYVGYTRVSTKEQAERGDSHEQQLVQLKAYAHQTGGRLIASFQDSASAFKKNAKHRPGLRSAIAKAKKNNAALLVATPDRLTRSLVDLEPLLESGIKLVSTDIGEVPRAVLESRVAKAQHESKQKSDRSKMQHRNKKDGSGSKVPRAFVGGRVIGSERNRERGDTRIREIARFLLENPGARKLKNLELVQRLNISGPKNLKSIVDGNRDDWTREALRPVRKKALKLLASWDEALHINTTSATPRLHGPIDAPVNTLQVSLSEISLDDEIAAVLEIDCSFTRELYPSEIALIKRIVRAEGNNTKPLMNELRARLTGLSKPDFNVPKGHHRPETLRAFHDTFRARLNRKNLGTE